jgi:hypothetical protein
MSHIFVPPTKIHIAKNYSYLMTYAKGEIVAESCVNVEINKTKKLRDFSPQANYTDRATAACRQS